MCIETWLYEISFLFKCPFTYPTENIWNVFFILLVLLLYLHAPVKNFELWAFQWRTPMHFDNPCIEINSD